VQPTSQQSQWWRQQAAAPRASLGWTMVKTTAMRTRSRTRVE
jgi:hypothetical protein